MDKKVSRFLSSVLNDLGAPITSGSRLLDFGCGQGALVREFRDDRVQASGVDIKPFWLEDSRNRDLTCFKTITQSPYRIPFNDDTFEFVISTSVFEHVLNPAECVREIHRVLKPGGVMLHVIPSPLYLPREPHTYIPLGNIIQNRFWLAFWALAGVRNEFQQGLKWRETFERNRRYYKEGLNYVPKSEMKKMIRSCFGNVSFPKEVYVRHAYGGAANLGRRFPLFLSKHFIAAFRMYLVAAKKQS